MPQDLRVIEISVFLTYAVLMYALQLALVGLMYIGFLVCVVGTGARLGKLARAPIQLRWELYPVPHEKGYDAVRDEVPPLRGSGFRQFYHGGLAEELKEMLKEMIFLYRVWSQKRRIWFFSFALHDGIYLVLIWFALLFVSSITHLAGLKMFPTVAPHPWCWLLEWLTVLSATVGALAIATGCIGLFIWRIVDKGMRQYATIEYYFNLVFIAAIAIIGLIPVVKAALDYVLANGFNVPGLIDYVYVKVFAPAVAEMTYLITFGTVNTLKYVSWGSLTPVVGADQVLFFLFLIYYPFTRLVHGPAKYVTYHMINWDDKPYLEGPLHYSYWGTFKIKER